MFILCLQQLLKHTSYAAIYADCIITLDLLRNEYTKKGI